MFIIYASDGGVLLVVPAKDRSERVPRKAGLVSNSVRCNLCVRLIGGRFAIYAVTRAATSAPAICTVSSDAPKEPA